MMQTPFLTKDNPRSSGTIYASYDYNSGQYPYGLEYVEPVRCLQEPQYWQPKETPGPRIDKKSSKLLTKLIGRVK